RFAIGANPSVRAEKDFSAETKAPSSLSLCRRTPNLLRGPAATVFEFFPTSARTRSVAADFWHFSADRDEIEFHLSIFSIGGGTVGFDLFRVSTWNRTGGGRCGWCSLPHQKLGQAGKECFKRLEIRSAAEK